MPEHLLSIFPLPTDAGAFARLTCLCISDPGMWCASPLLLDRGELEQVLGSADLPGTTEDILFSLDNGIPIQMAVHGATARQVGF